MRTFLFIALLLAPALAAAQEAPTTRVDIRANVLSGAALNSTQTIVVDLQQQGRPSTVSAWSKARLGIIYTYAAATAVVTTFYCAIDGTNYAQLAARSISGGTATVTPLADSLTTSGSSKTYMLEYDLRGCKKAKWTLTGTSANGSDVVKVDIALISGI